MTNLISGKEALIALASGQEVQLQVLGDMNWHDSTQWTVGELLCFKGKFRLKPRTITINGIEVPAPFEPRDGEKAYRLALLYRVVIQSFISVKMKMNGNSEHGAPKMKSNK